MTARDCIAGKAEEGTVDKDKAARQAELFDELEARHRAALGPGAADQAAVDATIALRRQVKQRKRRVLKQLRAQSEIQARAKAHPDQVGRAMLSVLDFDPRGQVAGPNVSTMKDVIRGRAHAIMIDFIDRHRSKLAGFRPRNRAAMRDVVRNLFGENAGDPLARAVAGGVAEGFEYLRRAFNQAGGDIPKRSDWGLPQMHDRQAVAAAAKEDWIDFTAGRLDSEKMVDLDTGLPMSAARLRAALSDVYDTVVSDGLADIQPGFNGFARRGIIARRQESRFLAFKDADAWLEYQDRFGTPDVFAIVTGHVEGMARDIATIQVLGPGPEGTMRFMEALIDQAAGAAAIAGTGRKAARLAGRIGAPKIALRDTYNSVTGALSSPADGFWASVSQGNRNVLVSAMLGTAFFSALSDRTFAGITARLNGIPAAKVLGRHLKLFLPGSDADRRMAVRLGFTAEGWASQAIAAQRYIGEVVGPEWTKWLADTTLRVSFLSPWTQAGRWGFKTEMLGFITAQADLAYDALPDALRGAFQRHGIDAADWDSIRATKLWRDPESGAEFLRPQDMLDGFDAVQADSELFRRRFDAANKLQAAILTEGEFAVPSSTARTRAILTGGRQAGTFWGEVLRNVTLFKSFPVTLLHTHLQRAATLQGGLAKGKYVAQLVIGTAIMGALGEQLSQISKGRDPIAMDPADEKGRAFWLKALARGGGLGIFGDFLFSDVNRFGGGIGATLLGPVIGSQLDAAGRLTIGNLQELVKEGEAKGAGRELRRLAELMTPGRSIWYGALAMERLVFDELQKTVDPDAAGAFQRIERRRRNETGQRFFAPPGRGLPPQRAPDLGAALGR